MPKTLTAVLFAAAVSLAWQSTNQVVHAEAPTKAKVVTKGKGHPEKDTTAVAVHQPAKPKPAPKIEKAPKALRVGSNWVPGDYFWDGADWQWGEGFWLEQPWSEAVWVPGHWSDRFWGWTWIPGYWF